MTGREGRVCLACRLRPGLPTAGEVFAQFHSQRHEDEAADFEQFCAIYPELAAELQDFQQAAKARHGQVSHASPVPESHSPPDAPGAPSQPESPQRGSARASESQPPGGRYEIQGVVARGGMGVIYAVRDRELNRQIAMKVIGTNLSGAQPISLEALPPSWIDRFVEEAQITAQLDHPNIVPVHEIGIDPQGRIYFTMKLVKGRGLSELFTLAREEREGWNLARAVSALVRACQAVAHAHEHGVVHRDLKPQNIMVGRLGEVYVMDWGLAKPANRTDLHDLRPSVEGAVHEGHARVEPVAGAEGVRTSDSPLVTMDGTVLGTPAYMSPEHAGGWIEKIGPASDVYSLGAVLYELLAGHPPYLVPGRQMSAKAMLDAVRAGPPEPIERIARDKPAELLAICSKAMARDAQARYRNAGELAEDVQAWLDRRVVRAYRTGALAELKSWILRNRLAAFSQAAAMALIIAGLAAVILLQHRSAGTIAQGKAALQEASLDLRGAVYAAAIVKAASAIERQDNETARAILDGCEPALRGWEWRYLDFSLPNMLAIGPQTTTKRLVGAVMTGDERRIVSIGADPVLDVWEVGGLRPLLSTPLGDQPSCLGLSQDDRSVAVGATNGTLRVVDLSTGASLWQARAHSGPIYGVAFSPDGLRLVAGGYDGVLTLWDTVGGRLLRTNRLGGRVHATSYSPDGRTILAGNEADCARILDANTLEEIRAFTGFEGGHNSAAFSPDGRRVVTGGSDGFVRIWDVDSGRFWRGFPAHVAGAWRAAGAVASNVWTVAFSPDGRWIVSAGEDRVIKFWESDTGRLHDTFAGHVLGWLPMLQFSRGSGRLLSAGGTGDAIAHLWTLHDHHRITVVTNHSDRVWAAAFTPDSRQLLTAGFDGGLHLSNADDGQSVRTFRGHTNRVIWSVVVSADGKRAVSSSQDCTLRVWDIESGKQLRAIRAQSYPDRVEDVTLFVAMSPDGRRVVSGGYDGNLQVWDIESGERIWAAHNRTRSLWGVAWSPDGRMIAATGYDGWLAVWNAARGAELWHTNVPPETISTVVFRPDGEQLMTVHGFTELRLWGSTSGRMLRRIAAQQDLIHSAAFSPDGRLIATAGRAQLVRLWDARLGEPLFLLPRESQGINFVAFSPDGKRLVSTGDDGRARIYQTEAPAAPGPNHRGTLPQ